MAVRIGLHQLRGDLSNFTTPRHANVQNEVLIPREEVTDLLDPEPMAILKKA
jgi:hypothetical protein